MTYILNKENALKMMVKDLREFIFENYYKQLGFSKIDNYYSLKNAEKIFGIVC